MSKAEGRKIVANMNIAASHDEAVGDRGPRDHTVRLQIIGVAVIHFSHYGYSKTTVSDLAWPPKHQARTTRMGQTKCLQQPY
ncbi:hypothetical protein HNQ99_001868 [Rhizorhapis suberifaciens]|uniref:Uncharacterized protein n=1 Tax=Rhizorhapis suberifaciens TaxID=13656 RepID=A0A840HVE7_9SPHN|nr:hypothetical protein [Rhizorhapis suberifaciens]